MNYDFGEFCNKFVKNKEKRDFQYLYGLTKMLTKTAVMEPLMTLLTHQLTRERIDAAKKLAIYGKDKFELEILTHVASHDLDLQVRKEASNAIHAINQRSSSDPFSTYYQPK